MRKVCIIWLCAVLMFSSMFAGMDVQNDAEAKPAAGEETLSVTTNIYDEIGPEAPDGWTEVGSAWTDSHVTTNGQQCYLEKSFTELATGNAFIFEAVVAVLPPGAGQTSDARVALIIVDGGCRKIEIRFTSNATNTPFIKLYDLSGGGEVERDSLQVDYYNSGSTDRMRVRLRRQEISGTEYLFLEAEREPNFEDPNRRSETTDIPGSRAVVPLSAFGMDPPGPPACIQFGHTQATGPTESWWESIHLTFCDDKTTLLPYWPPEPPAPTLVHNDTGMDKPQGVNLSADLSGLGYLANDDAWSELDADGTTYFGTNVTDPGNESWDFDGLDDDQNVTGRVVAIDVSGRSTAGPGTNLTIPDRSTLDSHLPIRINSNSDFDEAHGVVNWAIGDGSVGSPWIIEGWDINGAGFGYCIYVGNTTDYFIIQDCYLHDAGDLFIWPYYYDTGLMLHSVKNGTIQNNKISINRYGIILDVSQNNTISSNEASSNSYHGIWASSSNSNIINNNSASLNLWYGIYLSSSNNNTVTNNSATLSGGEGVYLTSSNYNMIVNNNASYNDYGIYLSSSNDNNITSNIASLNAHSGIYLTSSSSNTIANNNASSNNWYGIELYLSNSKNTITNNNASSNNYGGIRIYSSSSNTITNNTMLDDGICIGGDSLEHWNTHKIDTSNTVNGKPVHYWKNQTGGTVPLGAGQVILANCTNVVLKNQDVNNGSVGIGLGFSSNNTITNNNVSNNDDGIYLRESSSNTITNNNASNNDYGIGLQDSNSNTITNNTVSLNNGYGIILSFSSSNHIYHNNIINNTNHALDNPGTNFWDNGYPSGGNYWSDYNGVDFNNTTTQDVPPPDGIGDTPYTNIGGGSGAQDNYPLMEPWTPPPPLATYNITLTPGWNLISLPLIQSDESIDSVLSNISGKWDYIQAYDASDPADHWKSNNTFRPDQLNDLEILDHTMGFWINITEACTLEVMGYEPVYSEITLYSGWNMVSYPAVNDTVYTVADLKADTGATIVQGFNASQPYNIEVLADSYVLKRGEGYWIKLDSATTWTVDW